MPASSAPSITCTHSLRTGSWPWKCTIKSNSPLGVMPSCTGAMYCPMPMPPSHLP